MKRVLMLPLFPISPCWLLSFEIFRCPIYNDLYRLFLFLFRFSFVTGHYSQVIWADTNRVGCGFTSYRENGTLETNLYVCNYGPAGNFVALPSYKVGTPCSQCPTNTACSPRFAGLCGNTSTTTFANSVMFAYSWSCGYRTSQEAHGNFQRIYFRRS